MENGTATKLVITKAPALEILAQLLGGMETQVTIEGMPNDSDVRWNQFSGTITWQRKDNAHPLVRFRIDPFMHNCGAKLLGYINPGPLQRTHGKVWGPDYWRPLENLVVNLTNAGLLAVTDDVYGRTVTYAKAMRPDIVWTSPTWNPTYRWTHEHKIVIGTFDTNAGAHAYDDQWLLMSDNNPDDRRFNQTNEAEWDHRVKRRGE